jgi:hypothetical protein
MPQVGLMRVCENCAAGQQASSVERMQRAAKGQGFFTTVWLMSTDELKQPLG